MSDPRSDALRIWHAGVAAVHPSRLVPEHLHRDGDRLFMDDEPIDLGGVGRIVVVGAGKAAAAMASAVETLLGPYVAAAHGLAGWVNVPAGVASSVPETRVHLHQARPHGLNEPTAEAEAGTRQILRLVQSLRPQDLCLAVLSGGASALLPAPIDGLTLADKAKLTRELSACGANIAQLNAVRRELSVVKGGGLARSCRAGRLVALILSDVPGDDLGVIASGPTVIRQPTPQAAIDVLRHFQLDGTPAGRRAVELLAKPKVSQPPSGCRVQNILIGNNALAVDGAGIEAERLGYSHAMTAANEPEGPAEVVGRGLAQLARQMHRRGGPDCLITGGEPTVTLPAPEVRGHGGRNQQLCLAALNEMPTPEDWRGLALISGGTDGEDGPTDAAGAIVDEKIAAAASQNGLTPADFLARCDAYAFFSAVGGLLTTGPTETNVCDLRVMVSDRQ